MKTSSRRLDEWLALRCQAGVPGALDDLIAEMERPLFYYAFKLTGSQDAAFDVLQEVWLRMMQGIRKLKDPSSLRSWLYTMLHGIAIDGIRRKQARERAEETYSETFDGIQEPDFAADDAATVHLALDQLEPAHRAVLVLHFLEDFSFEEIARILQCPEGTVKSRVYYAKKALKAVISGETNANQ